MRHVCEYLALVMAAVVDVNLIDVNGRALGRVLGVTMEQRKEGLTATE